MDRTTAGAAAAAAGCVSLEPYALRVLDDSMAPDFPAGAVVVVEPGEPPVDGSFVVIEHEGAVMLRRLRCGGAGGGVRFEAPAAPAVVLADGAWRRAVRGVVTASRAPR